MKASVTNNERDSFKQLVTSSSEEEESPTSRYSSLFPREYSSTESKMKNLLEKERTRLATQFGHGDEPENRSQ